MTTVNKAPSLASTLKNLINTGKTALSAVVTVADVGTTLVADTITLGAKCVQSTPECLKELTQLPKYTQAQMRVNESEGSLTFEAALTHLDEEGWNSVQDAFKSFGKVTGNAISSTVKVLTEE